jgi:hypothetical protein
MLMVSNCCINLLKSQACGLRPARFYISAGAACGLAPAKENLRTQVFFCIEAGKNSGLNQPAARC